MPKETLQQVRARARAILRLLARAYPDWGPTLEFSNPFELLVATILAAQAQDERINLVTRDLFKKYRSPADYVRVPETELQQDIHATGFFRQKTKTIRAASQQILDGFAGEVPPTMEGLTSLQNLNLGGTNVTDAGLAHLKGLTDLQNLHLGNTKVTDAGVKELQQALPKAKITR